MVHTPIPIILIGNPTNQTKIVIIVLAIENAALFFSLTDNIKDTKNNKVTIKIPISSAIKNPLLKASPIDYNIIISLIKNMNIKIDIIRSITFIHLVGIRQVS